MTTEDELKEEFQDCQAYQNVLDESRSQRF